ncbi:MAG: hypothetical protein NTY42_07810 [Planctomycetota bacterium]|nr:hypothetical protein [Planctomycetota bacterium]
MDRDHPFRSYYSLPSQPIVLERDTHRFNPYANVDIRFVMLGAAILALVMNLVSPWFFNNWFTPQYFYIGRWTWESLAFLMFGLKLSELVVLGFALGVGTWHVAYRVLYVSTATILLTSGLVCGFSGMKIPLEIAILMFMASTIVVCITGCVTGLVSWWTKWGLARVSADHSLSVDLATKQYNTRLLFKVMIAVAICIPILQICFSMSARIGGPRLPLFVASVWLCWLAVGVTIYATVQLFAFLVPRAWGWRIAFGCLVIGGPYLFQWIGSQLVWGSLFAFRMNPQMIWMTYSLALGYTIGMSLFFLALRFLGFQLQRQVTCQNQDG